MNELAKFEPIDQFSAWRVALATGKPVAYERGAPTAGYFKRRARNEDRSIRWDAIAIWSEDGEWCCLTSAGYAPTQADEIEELFVNINSTPISYDLYEHVTAGGAWPEQVARVEDPDPELPPHEAAAAYLKKHRDLADAWLASLRDAEGKPRKPASQEEADKAANFAAEFAKIEKRAIVLHEVEKRPIIDAGKEIDTKWFVTRDAAKAAKVSAKALSDDFAKAESARRQREADEENARRQREFAEAKRLEDERKANEDRLRARGVQLPESARPPVEPPKAVVAEPVKIGTAGRRQSFRTFTTYAIDDATALLGFLATRNVKSAKLLEIALADARALHEVGTEVPGLLVGSEQRMV